MTANDRLGNWIASVHARLRRYIYWRGACGIALAVVAVMILAAMAGYRLAFESVLLWLLRLLLLAAVAGAAWWLLRRPLQQLASGYAADWIERRVPALQGRLRTLAETEQKQPANPVLGLLRADAARTVAIVDPDAVADRRLEQGFMAGAAVLALVFLGLLLTAPDAWEFGARRLLFGWMTGDAPPEQQIVVEPGDQRVRRGGDVQIVASGDGFTPSTMSLHARSSGGEWEILPMQQGADGSFNFTVYGVQDAMEYYVSGGAVRSPTFDVDLVETATVRELRITYHYPEWTGLPDREQASGARIEAVEGTEVTLAMVTDKPVRAPELRVNDERLPLTATADGASGSFTLSESGFYELFDHIADEAIALTDRQRIVVVKDMAPEITPLRPARDWQATNIEEVEIAFRARDDFRLQAVTLRYAVNGGEWRELPFTPTERELTAEHIMLLEEFEATDDEQSLDERLRQSMQQSFAQMMEEARGRNGPATATNNETEAEPAAEPAAAAVAVNLPPQGLVPGDLISYYLVASDRGHEVSSDIYFIQVQGFERRYTQSQQSGGGGGGGGGGQEQSEISRRQREILVSTWNLIRKRDAGDEIDAQYLADNAAMLADLQRTLAEQTETLVRRAGARGLSDAEPEAQRFIASLELAIGAMGPAAEALQQQDLNESIGPQQTALRHLVAAESVFRDIQLSFNNQGGGGGGNQGSMRDLAEIYELEMDLNKNQYEVRQSAQPQQQQLEDEDDMFDKLADLARRQEQLAERERRNGQLSLSERWRQEQLRREAEELREQLRRQQSAQQQSLAGAGDVSQRGGQQGGAQSSGDPQSELADRLDDIIESMERAGAESAAPGSAATAGQGNAQRNDSDGQRATDAADAAERLQATLDQLANDRQRALRDQVESVADKAADLAQAQEEASAQLQEALARAMRASREGQRDSGLDPIAEAALAEQKRDMAREVEALEDQIDDLSRRIADQAPQLQQTLEDATQGMDDSMLRLRLARAAEAIEVGMAPEVAVTEGVVDEAIERLREQLDQARGLAASELVPGGEGEAMASGEQSEDLQAVVQSLRQRLAESLEQAQGAGGEQGGEGAGSGQDQQGLAQGGNGGPGSGRNFGLGGGWRWQEGIRLPPDFRGADQVRQAQDIARELARAGLNAEPGEPNIEQLQAAEQFARNLAAGGNNDDRLILERTRALVTQLEQLELALGEGNAKAAVSTLRHGADSGPTGAAGEEVADYFRRLGDGAAPVAQP
ncbi:MAG: hypothetical protein H6978_02785 [Gammaproteobacteria bacterium]|nr:hypothetical protein [Gammaproteobacteria bacterium]